MKPLICTCKPAPDLLCSLCPANLVSDSACPFPCIRHSSLCFYSDIAHIISYLCRPINHLLSLSLISFLFFFILSIVYPELLALTSFSISFSLAPNFHRLYRLLVNHSTSHIHILPSSFVNLNANLPSSSSSTMLLLAPTPLSVSSLHPSLPQPPPHPPAHNHQLVRLLFHHRSTFPQAAPAANSPSD